MSDYLIKIAIIRGIAAAARKYAPQLGSKLLTAGMGGEIKRQAIAGGVLGGLMQGGVAAYTAEDGQKLRAFRQGATTGAGTGALMGGLTGVVTAPARNVRRHLMASRYGDDVAKATLDAPYHKNLRALIGGPDPAMPRGAAAIEAIAAPATLAAEIAIPGAIYGAGQAGIRALQGDANNSRTLPAAVTPEPHVSPPPPRDFQTRTADIADDHSRIPHIEPLYLTPFTSATGAALVDTAIDKLHPNMPTGIVRKRILPAAGAAALTIPVVTALRAHNQKADPLEDLDLDALKIYFGKQPATH